MEKGEKVLNKLEEFRQKQRDLEWEKRKKRNAEVDQLISQLGDPKVAEKLRIYRLVEEQFTHIEAQVEREVQAELDAKKAAKNAPPNAKVPLKMDVKRAGNLLHKARNLRVEIAKGMEDENPPPFIKDNLAKVKAERELKAKEKLLGPRRPKQPMEKISFKPEPVKSIPDILYQRKKTLKKKVDKAEQDYGIVMLSKPIIRDRRELSKNVGYVAFSHVDEAQEVDQEEDSQRKKLLSAHILCGINISPKPHEILVMKKDKDEVVMMQPNTIISDREDEAEVDAKEADMDEPDISELTSSKNKPLEPALERLLSPAEEVVFESCDQLAINDDKEEMPAQDASADKVEEYYSDYNDDKEEMPAQDASAGKVEEYYSDSFEEEDPDDLLKEFIPKMMAMREFADEDSMTGRLSTIPEVPSQATSVDDSNKVLFEGSLESSSSSLITSPIRKPIIVDALDKLSLSEGPMLMSDESSSLQTSKQIDLETSLVLSEGPLEKIPVAPNTKVDQAVMTVTLPELDLTPSERRESIPSERDKSNVSTVSSAPSTMKNSMVSLPINSSSSSSLVAASSSSASLLSNSDKTDKSYELALLSEGQVIVPHSLLLSEGELPNESRCFESDSSLKDSLDEGEAK